MHAIVREDGSHTQSRFVRVSATVAYACLALTGLLVLLSPRTIGVYGDSGPWLAGFVLLGALLSAVGSATRRWVGEFVGGPLLGTGLAVFGLETWDVLRADYPYFSVALATLFVGTAMLIVTRWRMVLAIYHFVHAVALTERRIAGGDDE